MNFYISDFAKNSIFNIGNNLYSIYCMQAGTLNTVKHYYKTLQVLTLPNKVKGFIILYELPRIPASALLSIYQIYEKGLEGAASHIQLTFLAKVVSVGESSHFLATINQKKNAITYFTSVLCKSGPIKCRMFITAKVRKKNPLHPSVAAPAMCHSKKSPCIK